MGGSITGIRMIGSSGQFLKPPAAMPEDVSLRAVGVKAVADPAERVQPLYRQALVTGKM